MLHPDIFEEHVIVREEKYFPYAILQKTNERKVNNV